MTLKEYTDGCKKFAADSAEWGGLDPEQFYVATPLGWVESCDNAVGGIRLAWAFHVPADAITEKVAWLQYLAEFSTDCDCAVDDEWDKDGWDALAALYEDCFEVEEKTIYVPICVTETEWFHITHTYDLDQARDALRYDYHHSDKDSRKRNEWRIEGFNVRPIKGEDAQAAYKRCEDDLPADPDFCEFWTQSGGEFHMEEDVVNSAGMTFDDSLWGDIMERMDDDLREQLNVELAPCTHQAFFDAYAAAHLKKFGEQWELDKANPQW